MKGLIAWVGVLNFAVTFFLLLAACLLAQQTPRILRSIFGALIGGIHSSLCLLPKLQLFGSNGWRLGILLVSGCMAFGICRTGIRKTVLFLLLELALTGFAVGLEQGITGILMTAGAVSLLSLMLIFQKTVQTIPVELTYQERKIRLTALKDTGNTLKDPLSGQPVLIIDPEAAEKLTGLTRAELKDPVKTISRAPITGLRLIPYHTISNPAGFLLALQIQQGKVGDRRGCVMTAFAPEELDREGNIQALIGGSV